MLLTLDQWFDVNASWVDTMALFIVAGIALKRKDLISIIILVDFIIVYFGQNWIKSLSLWGSLGIDYHYTLGIKDALIALGLLCLAAHPMILLSYIIPSLLCWGVWGSYSLLEYERFLSYYYAWSPLYALAMFLQIYGLTFGDSSAGKRIRRRALPINWDRIFQPINRIIYARITLPTLKI